MSSGDDRIDVDDWARGAASEPPTEPARHPQLLRAERRLERRAKLVDWALPVIMFVVPLLALAGIAETFLAGHSTTHRVNERADSVVASNGALSKAVGDESAAVDRLSVAVQAMAVRQDRLDAIAAALGRLETASSEAERLAAMAELRAASRMDAAAAQATTTTTTTTTTTAPARGSPGGGSQPPPSSTTTSPPSTTTTTVNPLCRPLLPRTCPLP